MSIELSAQEKAKLCNGIKQYLSLKKMLARCGKNAILCECFQKKYDGFYRVRRDQDWREHYFKWMYEYFDTNPSFEEVLTALNSFEKTGGKIEASFASKLLHTLNNDLPIWDSKVMAKMKQFGVVKKTTFHSIKECVDAYESICEWYRSSNAKNYVDCFNSEFKNEDISDTKKADFILWGIE